MKFRIRFADQVVGLFVILSIGIVALMVVLIGLNQRWFSTNYYFTSLFDDASGLDPGTAIKFNGKEIGKVENNKLNANNQIDVTFYIYDTYIEKVTENSVLELAKSVLPGLGGGLVFHPGLSKKPAAKNAFIPSAGSETGRALIEAGMVDSPPRVDIVNGVVSNLNNVLENLNDALEGRSGSPVGSMLVTLKNNLPSMMASLNSSLDSLQALMGKMRDPDGLVPRLLGPGSVSTFLSDNDAMYKQVQKVMVQLDEMMVTFNKAAKDIQATTNAISGEVPKLSSLILETKTAIQSAQDVMEGLKNNPFLKGGISPRPEQDSKLDSLRAGGF